MAASASSKPLQQAVTQIIQRASVATATHVDPAVESLTESQNGLEAELQRLDDKMASVTSVLETVTLDPETSARMQETQECLKRTKKKLITIRGRLGRLRAYEESDRLQLTERSLDVFREGIVGSGREEDEDVVEAGKATSDEHNNDGEAVVEDNHTSIVGTDDSKSGNTEEPKIAPSELPQETEESTPASDGLT